MRECRGIRKDNGERVYGWYWRETAWDGYKDRLFHYIKKENHLNHEVVPETVGQQTGKKDKNGVESYEKDRIAYKALGSLFTGIIIWCEANFTWVVDAIDGDELKQRPFLAHLKDFEIIGSIHNNSKINSTKK